MNQKPLLWRIVIIITLILGAFGGGFYLGQNWPKGDKPASANPPWITKNLPPPLPKEEPIPEQRLTFYDKLTETPGKAPKNNTGKEKAEPKSKPAETAPAKYDAAPAKATKGNYVVHIASLKNQSGAQDMAAQLNKKGYKVKVVAVDLGEKGKWYRLLISGYNSKEEAERTAESLRKKEGLSPLVRYGNE